MKFIDMFCGMGTIRMGFEQAGHTCVYSIEWDKHKRKIYEVIFGNEPEGRDITTVRGADLPHADCWTFGAPCQDFSIAGARTGLEGDRSSLIREVFRLVREVEEEYRPEWLLYENVKGMLSSNKGLDYLEILFEMASLGYDIEYQLLNSKDFGVPQNRERVFTLGHSRRFSSRKIFPIGESDGLSNHKIQSDGGQPQTENITTTLRASGNMKADGTYIIESERQTQGLNMVGMLEDGEFLGRHESARRVYGTDGIGPSLNTCGGGGLQTKILIENQVKCLNSKDENGKQPPQQARIYDTSGLMTALQAEQGGRFNIVEPSACLTPNRPEKRQNGRRFKEPGEPMFTLTGQDVHGVMLRSVRTEYGKDVRKDYENGTIKESRHNMTQLEPRPDGISNTLSTVQKDNLLLVPSDKEIMLIKCKCGEKFITDSLSTICPCCNSIQSGKVTYLNQKMSESDLEKWDKWEQEEIDECEKAIEESEQKIRNNGVDCFSMPVNSKCHQRIRRLTPRECMRLQGVPDYITDKLIKAGISDTQMYRAAGDACSVPVIYEIAKRM